MSEQRDVRGLSFGDALVLIKSGKRVSREGWNGKGMWLSLVPQNPLMPVGYVVLPWIGMKTVNDQYVPWLASQTDVLAEDWHEVES